jgi:aryl-alcohol dehydrogenase-like predicted oxidoreductase
MERRKLGSQGLEVSALGLGCMGMSAFYGSTDEPEALATIDRALELGVDFLDTAEMYGPHTNEQLVGKAIAGKRDSYVIATKFGIRVERGEDGSINRVRDGTPENLRRSVEGSLERLGTDRIDLYYQHRIDPKVPIEETVGTLGELVAEGKILHVGLSEAAPETIRRAHATHPITAVQTEYSLWTRDLEQEILPTLRELGIGLVPYSPLGRGFLSGRFKSPEELDADDFRRQGPRFTGANLEANLALAAKVEELATEKGCTPAQLALGWVLAQGEDVVPIPGTKRRSYLEQNVGAVEVELSTDDLARIDAELPAAAGDRYDPQGMTTVNV